MAKESIALGNTVLAEHLCAEQLPVDCGRLLSSPGTCTGYTGPCEFGRGRIVLKICLPKLIQLLSLAPVWAMAASKI